MSWWTDWLDWWWSFGKTAEPFEPPEEPDPYADARGDMRFRDDQRQRRLDTQGRYVPTQTPDSAVIDKAYNDALRAFDGVEGVTVTRGHIDPTTGRFIPDRQQTDGQQTQTAVGGVDKAYNDAMRAFGGVEGVKVTRGHIDPTTGRFIPDEPQTQGQQQGGSRASQRNVRGNSR